MDLNIGEIVLLAVVVWIVSQVLLGVMDAFQLIKLSERVKLLKHLDEIVHQVKIETVGDMEYWYDETNNSFLGQGKTLDEVVGVLKSRFPEHVFLIKDKGGIAAQTNWKLMNPDEFRKHTTLNN